MNYIDNKYIYLYFSKVSPFSFFWNINVICQEYTCDTVRVFTWGKQLYIVYCYFRMNLANFRYFNSILIIPIPIDLLLGSVKKRRLLLKLETIKFRWKRSMDGEA